MFIELVSNFFSVGLVVLLIRIPLQDGDSNPGPDPVWESWQLLTNAQQFTVQNLDQLVFVLVLRDVKPQ